MRKETLMKRCLTCSTLLPVLFIFIAFHATMSTGHASEIVTFSGVITFNDGTPVSHVSMEKDVTAFPLFADPPVDISDLQTQVDAGGLYRFSFRHPGRYELRLWGTPITEFEVVNTGTGLSVSGLSPNIRLPFDYLIRINQHKKKD